MTERRTPRGKTARLREITAAALMDERRATARAVEEKRLVELEKISPRCERKGCGHKLNRHDPCSECRCPGFVGRDNQDARAASDPLIKKHADLFPQSKERSA